MKIIDLLNKIANGEEVPKKIKINNFIYEYRGCMYCTEKANYQNIEDYLFGKWNFNILNNEVEILEEKPTQEEIKEYTNKFLEVWNPVNKLFGKLFDELSRIKEDELEEEKKIPEKLDISNFPRHNNSLKKTAIKLNELIDYLKSKGE